MTDETASEAFEGEIAIGEIANQGAPADAGVLNLKFVRYPGCQQLILWLPAPGYQGYTTLRVGDANGAALEEGPVQSHLNGSVQILFDTLPWPPGDYRIEIAHQAGWRHVASLQKLPEGVPLPPEPAPAPEPSKGPIVYRDGFGNLIPDVDLQLRAEATAAIAARFSRRLEFEGNFRGGTIIYIDAERRIRFWHEMAASPYHFLIETPTVEKWVAETGAPITLRDEIIRFVAEETQRRQASSWKFEIRPDCILFL